jgi:hypothetical protein
MLYTELCRRLGDGRRVRVEFAGTGSEGSLAFLWTARPAVAVDDYWWPA